MGGAFEPIDMQLNIPYPKEVQVYTMINFANSLEVMRDTDQYAVIPPYWEASSHIKKPVHMDECYFASAVHRMIEKNQTIHEYKMKLYKTIAETTDLTVVLESFAEYNAQADTIMKEFLQFIDSKVEDFCSNMIAYIKSYKDIEANRDNLLNKIKYYNDDEYEGYMFTIDDKLPNLSALKNFNASLFDDLFKGSVINDLSSENIANVIANIDLEQDYKRFRALVVGLYDQELSENEFVAALRRVFRNGQDTPVELRIDVESIKSIADKWFHFNEYYKRLLDDDLKAIQDAIDSITAKIEAICKHNNGLTLSAVTNLLPGDIKVDKVDGKAVDFEGMRLSDGLMVQLDMFCKLKLDQLQKYTDIICMALMAKIDAMKNSIRQNSFILGDCVEVMSKPNVYYNVFGDNEKIEKDPVQDTLTLSRSLSR